MQVFDKMGNAVEMDLQTRFPMFGGWQTQFYFGYSVPTEAALSVDADSGRYSLKVPTMQHYLHILLVLLESTINRCMLD